MFGTIRRHQSWLWAIIVTLMIISLLYWADQNPNRSGQMGEKATVLNGKTVTPKMFGEAQREVDLLYFLNFRKWPEQDSERARQMNFDRDDQAWLRLLRVAKAEEAGVQVSKDTVAALAKRLLGDFPLDKFEKEVLKQNNLDANDFERFVRHDAVIQQLSTVIGAAGRLITPTEAEALYRRDHQEVGSEIVFFNVSNYLSKVAITNGALTNFFTQRQFTTYRVPDKLRVSYVEFPKTNFYADADKQFAAVTNLEMQLREMYLKSGGTNSFKDTNGVPLSEAAAIAKIKEDQRERMALGFANKRANEFANKIYDLAKQSEEKGGKVLPALLDNVAASEGLQTQVTMPFDIAFGPTNLDVSPMFTRIAFQLDATNAPISFQPIPGEHAMYLIALKELVPGRAQPFEEVKKQVEEDYRYMNAFPLVRADSSNFVARATNELAKGKSFTEVAAQSNLKAETLPPISRATESVTNLEERLDVRRLKSIALTLEPGRISDFVMTPPEGGYLLHVRARIPFDEAKLREELPKFTSQLRYQKQNELFDIWFNKQVEKANLPLRQASPRRPGA